MNKFLVALQLAFFSISSGTAQDLVYAKEVVNTLASKEFYGRGYVSEGDKIAANYIQSEFKKIGLQAFDKNYFQKFSTSVNSFPSAMQLTLNGKTITSGADYIIDAGSPGIKGEFETILLTTEDLLNDAVLKTKLQESAGKFVVISNYDKTAFTKEEQKKRSDRINLIQYNPENPALGTIILTNDKLTWSGFTTLNAKPSFIVKADSAPKPIEKVGVDVENKFYKKYQSQNVMGYIEGKKTDSLIVLVAHYDHLGMMGAKTLFPGANDNASGVAMLLNFAKQFKNNKPEYTTVFIAFGGEEIGLVGSKAFVANPLFPLSKIKFLINFDLAGTGDEGIQVVNGKLYKDEFDRLVAINNEQHLLKEIKIRGEACNSDHCLFHAKKVPCFYIYTLGGTKAYHDIYDKAETLPLSEFEDYFKLLLQFIEGI